MLPKPNRLTKKKDFDAVFKKGKTVQNTLSSVRVLPTKRKENRFGIIVSKKVSPSAVTRNAIRRRLAAVAAQVNTISDRTFDAVIIALPPMKGKKFSEVQPVIQTSLKKAFGHTEKQ